jgi:hypothetical protein
MLTAEVNGVASQEVFQIKWWNSNPFGLQISKGTLETRDIGGVSNNSEICITAKFGRAVKHARLSAHEERAHVVRAHRRKDFAYRVRDQANLREPDTFATASRFPTSVARV